MKKTEVSKSKQQLKRPKSSTALRDKRFMFNNKNK